IDERHAGLGRLARNHCSTLLLGLLFPIYSLKSNKRGLKMQGILPAPALPPTRPNTIQWRIFGYKRNA
ncbi:hypothetical protein, partial [Gloeocapsopsis dulcis]